jgi:hypothetical protein
MKASNTVVSAIVIAAVLVSAYAIGLMIRQARTGGPAAQPTSVEKKQVPGVSHGPLAEQSKDTSEARVRAKEQKAKAIEKMSSATPEEKEKFQSQVYKQVGGRRGGKGRQSLPPEALEARKARMQGPSQAGGQKEDANGPASQSGSSDTKQDADKAGAGPSENASAPASQGDSTNTKRGTDEPGAEPGKAGPG